MKKLHSHDNFFKFCMLDYCQNFFFFFLFNAEPRRNRQRRQSFQRTANPRQRRFPSRVVITRRKRIQIAERAFAGVLVLAPMWSSCYALSLVAGISSMCNVAESCQLGVLCDQVYINFMNPWQD